MELEDKNLYYVGGVVRDELLGKTSIDIDLCYEGNAIEFAQSKHLDIIKKNDNLGTVRIIFNGKEVDIASTRCETYPQKGHLPTIVELGCPLKQDLQRRDFTINAMAKKTIDGEIIDYYGGIEDIKSKTLRILHKNSFIDDPTRIIRGLKFAVRFGFSPDEETLSLQKQYLCDVNYDMSYHRLKKELVDAFSLNKKEVFEIFLENKMYKLLGKLQKAPNINIKKAEELIKENPSQYCWLTYLSFFDLSNLPLLRREKRILEWASKLETQPLGNNTPAESILINRIRSEAYNV